MRILQISDTHNRHQLLADLPAADVLIHCGDFTDMGTEQEVLDFLNWLIELPYPYKLFVTGNHDLCLWDAENIEDLPQNIYFLQDRGCEIGNVKFFGLGYNQQESLIPTETDILVTHEPPMMILDKSSGRHWGNLLLRNRVMEVKPQYHLFGHTHESYGIVQTEATIFSNASVLDNQYRLRHTPRLIEL